MKEFSAYDCALDGINLIEAGAGTGKTYNIQTLTARIVLEKAIPVTRILVVTYTRAATAELRERLRKVLDSLLRMLEGVPVPDGEEERCRTILDNLRKLPEDAPFWTMQIEGIKPRSPEETFLRNAKLLLQNALRDFDQAAISTIHSFCQRMLTENAFESGIRYGIELVSDTSAVTDALIQQFIRREFYACTPEETAVWRAWPLSGKRPARATAFHAGAPPSWNSCKVPCVTTISITSGENPTLPEPCSFLQNGKSFLPRLPHADKVWPVNGRASRNSRKR